MGDKKIFGQWGELFTLPNVPVHAALLPNGKVLHWGRREDPTKTPQKDPPSVKNGINNMDDHFTKSFLWTPPPPQADGKLAEGKLGKSDPMTPAANQPTYINPATKQEEKVNLFCSGHCLMPDGNLLVTGGHMEDGWGTPNTNIFNWKDSTWSSQQTMHNGRWYPSVLSLPDGRMLCMSGSYDPDYHVNNSIPQILSTDVPTSSAISGPKAAFWTEARASYGLPRSTHVGFPADDLKFLTPLYPRLHINPNDGQIFMTGPEPDSMFLQIKAEASAQSADVKDGNGVVGSWKVLDDVRPGGFRDYASSVMYAPGKIMYMGGGLRDGKAWDTTEFIDLNNKSPKWEIPKDPQQPVRMKNARRQFNGTILPDGTVLVTGGTSGTGFNNLAENVLVKKAELMDPGAPNREWKLMAAEDNSRCYHSVALLLPDGRVLSAGGGEWAGPLCTVKECHADAQLFEPPYLHRGGPRLSIATKPDNIKILYNKPFSIEVGPGDTIEKVNLVKLGSVTHCCNFNQQFVPLNMTKQEGTKVSLIGPRDPNFAPPGHYMLFVLNKDRVPSVGAIIQIAPLPANNTPPVIQTVNGVSQIARQARIQPTLLDHDEHIKRINAEQNIPQVKVGITPLCPYGLGPCWAGAHNGLQAVSDIDVVRPVPHKDDCMAYVYLNKPDTLPDLEVWRKEFMQSANQGYEMRGIDMTLSGVVAKGKSGADELVLNAKGNRPEVTLRPFKQASQLRWNIHEKSPKPITDEEAGMYKKLVGAWVDRPAGVDAEIKGTLLKQGNGKFTLDVRTFKALSH